MRLRYFQEYIYAEFYFCLLVFMFYVHILTHNGPIQNMFENHSFWIAWSLEIWGDFTQNEKKSFQIGTFNSGRMLGLTYAPRSADFIHLPFILPIFQPRDIPRKCATEKAKISSVSDFVANCKFISSFFVSWYWVQILDWKIKMMFWNIFVTR